MEERANLNTAQSDSLTIPAEVQQEAKKMVREAFDLFAHQAQQMAADLAEFNKKQQKLRDMFRKLP